MESALAVGIVLALLGFGQNGSVRAVGIVGDDV